MSREGKTLSSEERDRLNAALAMSELASGFSPVKTNAESNSIVARATISSPSDNTIHTTPVKVKMEASPHRQLASNIHTLQHVDTQTEPLDLSSPSPNSKKSFSRRDSGNYSPDPKDSADHKDPEPRSVVSIQPKSEGSPVTPTQWNMFRPSVPDYSSGYSSTSGYESFSEAPSEVESPDPLRTAERVRSSLPPKKRKHIRQSRTWEDEGLRKKNQIASTSSVAEDDEVFMSENPKPKPHTTRSHKGEAVLQQQLIKDLALAITPDEEGDLPLHIAVVQSNKEVIERVTLLMNIAKLSLDTYNGLRQTPLHLAVITGEAEIVSFLIHQGASVDYPDRDGNTSLHLAVKHRKVGCLNVMLKTKVDVNGKNYEGLTPLHLAVQEQSVDCAIILLDAGADIDCQDGKSGRTALHHAVETTCGLMVHELLKRGASVNQPSYAGCSPLQVASGRGHLDIVQLLVQYGADTTLRNVHLPLDSQATLHNTQGGATGSRGATSGQRRYQMSSVKRKIREKVNS